MLLSFGLDHSLEDLSYTQYRKPYFKPVGFDFNISHSGNCVACIGSDTSEIGIDIEKIVPLDIEAYQPHFSEEEWNEITHRID